jgi:DNA-binding transcriptional ArsR family regulator
MKVLNMEIFEIHASYCAVLASSKRLAIMACLDKKEMSVGELAEAIDCPLSTVSRHLTLLKGKHLVDSRKDGTTVYNRPADSRIIEACAQIRSVLFESMKQRGVIAHEIDLENLVG